MGGGYRGPTPTWPTRRGRRASCTPTPVHNPSPSPCRSRKVPVPHLLQWEPVTSAASALLGGGRNPHLQAQGAVCSLCDRTAICSVGRRVCASKFVFNSYDHLL